MSGIINPPRNYLKSLEAGETLNLYANGTTGDDNNDGLTALTPKKTISAVAALVPARCKTGSICRIHLRGVFDLTSSGYLEDTFSGTVDVGSMVIIDGGQDLTELVASATADISGASRWVIGLSTLALTPDQYAGYWLEILDGPAAGQVRTIYKHDATTFTVNQQFSVDPGNANYRIVRPSTEITAASSSYFQVFFEGGGRVAVQGCFISGSIIFKSRGTAEFVLGSVVYDGTQSIQLTGFYVNLSNYYYVGGPLWYSSDPLWRPGCTLISTSMYCKLNASELRLFNGVVLCYLEMTNSAVALGGCRFKNLVLQDCTSQTAAYGFHYYSGRQPCLIEGATGVGLQLIKSDISIQRGALEINNCTSHAIESINSLVKFNSTGAGSVIGVGNAGAGIYAHSGSVVHVDPTNPPTLTGTVGDVAVSDPTVQDSTWASVAGGTPVAMAAEMTLVKAG